MATLFPPPAVVSIPIKHSQSTFPVHRIYCVGRNYAEHAKEMGFDARELPFFFGKQPDAILYVPEGETGRFPYPAHTENLHHEVELVVAIGKGGSAIPAAVALEHVLGFAVGLDMTRRDLQFALRDKGRPWDAAKAFDHAAPISAIAMQEDVGNMSSGGIWLKVNEQPRQASDVTKLIWSIGEIIEHLSGYFTLQPGDLIFTGTPEGVGPVRRGDVIHAGVERVGELRVQVV
ncbi:MAG: FAA hydrolase family protein [Burkholderiaceae bacterium]|nr:MAG: FAA hydrolase family protein [Burkholderiaceae bacterium]